MKNTTQYVGYTKEDDIMHMMIVDMLDLPHDMFSAEKPLHIDADVNMGKGKKAPLPDFSNVIIKGVFDCSDFTISEDSVLPKGITGIICLHSIGNLSVLIGKLPKTVTKVVEEDPQGSVETMYVGNPSGYRNMIRNFKKEIKTC